MDRTQKQQEVASLKEAFDASNSLVVLHYRGLDVNEISDLRNTARAQGVTVKVAKNKLARIAANDGKFSNVVDLFTGPTAFAYSEDEVATAKTIVNFAKENEKVAIIGGFVSGNTLDEAGVKALASVPSLDESRSKLVGLLQAPATKLAQLMQAPAGQTARVIGARGAQAE